MTEEIVSFTPYKIQTTLITHIYNEEYLLPFFLIHHKDMFDNIIIIDYQSDDRSLEICKKICPNCKIIQSRNKYFKASEVDKEVMDIERTIDGIKIVLTVPEFLFCENIKDLFCENIKYSDEKPAAQFSIREKLVYSPDNYNFFPKNNYELFNNVSSEGVFVSSLGRSSRFIHNYPHGNYGVGRHWPDYKGILRKHSELPPEKILLVCFGYCPLNKHMIRRRTQQGERQPEEDIIHRVGFHCQWDEKQIINHHVLHVGSERLLLKKDFPNLDNLIKNKLEQLNSLDDYSVI
tara:strand:- start:7368 stop:8240 length:873 start_codon:yes stop_codon:yes gene_type:complete